MTGEKVSKLSELYEGQARLDLMKEEIELAAKLCINFLIRKVSPGIGWTTNGSLLEYKWESQKTKWVLTNFKSGDLSHQVYCMVLEDQYEFRAMSIGLSRLAIEHAPLRLVELVHLEFGLFLDKFIEDNPDFKRIFIDPLLRSGVSHKG